MLRSRNMTLRSLADFAHCMDFKVNVSLQHREAMAPWHPMTDAILVQFNQTLVHAAPLNDIASGTWTTISNQVA